MEEEELNLESGNTSLNFDLLTYSGNFLVTGSLNQKPLINFIGDVEKAKNIRDWLNKYIEEHS